MRTPQAQSACLVTPAAMSLADWQLEASISNLLPAACRHPELAEAAGAECLFGDPGGHVATLSLKELVASEPDCIIFAPCGVRRRSSGSCIMKRSVRQSACRSWRPRTLYLRSGKSSARGI